MLEYAIIAQKNIKITSKTNDKIKMFLLTGKIKQYFYEKHWNIFFILFMSYTKIIVELTKLKKKVLQSINHENRGYHFFCILINHNHTNHVTGKMAKNKLKNYHFIILLIHF